jgi:hypothetical protein
VKIPVCLAFGEENTFFEWMIIDSGPAECLRGYFATKITLKKGKTSKI